MFHKLNKLFLLFHYKCKQRKSGYLMTILLIKMEAVVQRVKNLTAVARVSAEAGFRTSTRCNGLKGLALPEMWYRPQPKLGFNPWPGISICHGCGHKQTEKDRPLRCISTKVNFFFFFGFGMAWCGISVPRPGAEPRATTVKAPNPNH